MPSSVFYRRKLGNGSYSKVYEYITGEASYAVKLIELTNKKNTVDVGLQEVGLAKLASILKVGPKFVNIFGYDAIIFQSDLQFAMEMCEPA